MTSMDSANIDADKPVATGADTPHRSVQEIHAMSGLLFLGIFFGVLVVASAFGWTADTREGGDWSPSNDGRRCARC